MNYHKFLNLKVKKMKIKLEKKIRIYSSIIFLFLNTDGKNRKISFHLLQ
jgi:hypothetical protein